MNNKALIVVDMIYDFVYGKFGNEYARNIIANVESIISKARSKGIPVIYLKDTHLPTDPETKHWGQHAMKDDVGSEIIPELTPAINDIVVSKSTYSGYYNTTLESILEDLQVKEVILVGVSTNICVQHNAADSFFRGYKVTVIESATAAFESVIHLQALQYMRDIYGVKTIDSETLIKEWEP
ncbi:MAG: Peroxyureidoacrylate/ureidoacrylate amidohydrolase RutB [candidate division WS2 bacterium]|nr:Peroxyureidoacrylate/ureidoacrylate amidohydrolase RutB [Candidatus Psychracetigena formicireducens]